MRGVTASDPIAAAPLPLPPVPAAVADGGSSSMSLGLALAPPAGPEADAEEAVPVPVVAVEAATTAAAAAGESSCSRAAAFCAARALASGVLAALEPARPERADANGVWWCGRRDDGRGEAAAAAKNESAVLAPPRGVHGEGAAATFRRGTAALAPITPRAEDKGSGDVSDDEAAGGLCGG